MFRCIRFLLTDPRLVVTFKLARQVDGKTTERSSRSLFRCRKLSRC